MTETETSRTLVKSPPELWAECSDATSLARHLDGFGEIRITRLEPETAVAWEGERASGTVRLEPSGWGTRVTLTAQAGGEPQAAPVPEEPPQTASVSEPEPVELDPEPEPVELDPEPEPVELDPEPRGGLLGVLRGLFRRRSAPVTVPAEAESDAEPSPAHVAHEPEPAEPEPTEPEPAKPEPADIEPVDTTAQAVLAAALDSLGQAHRRPFTRG